VRRGLRIIEDKEDHVHVHGVKRKTYYFVYCIGK
jgi:hypothetical protein